MNHSLQKIHHSFTLFYDGKCPLCLREVKYLETLNNQNRVKFINLHDPDKMKQYPSIDISNAMKVLHGISSNGSLVLGLRATHGVWSILGKGHITFILTLPLLAPIFNFLYRLFARNRSLIGKMIFPLIFNNHGSGCTEKTCQPIVEKTNV